MPLVFDTLAKQVEREKAKGTMHKLAARTYVNADRTKVVPEDSPEAAFLLGTEGQEILVAEAEALGLLESKLADVPSDKKLKATENKKKG